MSTTPSKSSLEVSATAAVDQESLDISINDYAEQVNKQLVVMDDVLRKYEAEKLKMLEKLQQEIDSAREEGKKLSKDIERRKASVSKYLSLLGIQKDSK